MFTGFSLPVYSNCNNSQRQEFNQQQVLASVLNFRDYQQRLQLLLSQQQYKFGAYPHVPVLQSSNQGFMNRSLVFPQSLLQGGNLPQTNRVTIIQPIQAEKDFQHYGFNAVPAVKVEQPSELPIETGIEDNFKTVQIKQEYVADDMDIQDEVTDQSSETDSKDLAAKVSASKKIKKVNERAINTCGHPERKHYAKGLCNNCYHKYGRIGKPELCGHDVIYAKGLCQKCYLVNYNQQKNQSSKKKRRPSKKCARRCQKQN